METWLVGLGPLRSVPEQWRGGKTATVPIETWINGEFDIFRKHFNAASGFLEQRIGRDLVIELAGNIEDVRIRNVEPMRSTDISIMYDPNLYLPTGAPNPYAVDEAFLKPPPGRTLGSSSGVAVDSRGHIWVADRCGANSCVGSATMQFFVRDDPRIVIAAAVERDVDGVA